MKVFKVYLSLVLVILISFSCSQTFDEVIDHSSVEFSQEEINLIKEHLVLKSISQEYKGKVVSDDRFRIEQSDYLIYLKLESEKEGIKMPNGVRFKGIEFYDDGRGFDEVANDGIYTAKEFYKVFESQQDESKLGTKEVVFDKNSPNAWCIGCDAFDIVAPGEECLEEGECSEDEGYLFCFCGSVCYFCIGSDCECTRN